ncbi:MAG: phage portal protein [Oligoflexales bacterium]
MAWKSKTEKAKEAAKRKAEKLSMQQRQFQAAMRDRIHNWNSLPNSIDQDLKYDLVTMRGLSKQLSRDNDYMKRYYGLLKDHVIGSKGIILQCNFTDNKGLKKSVNKKIEDAFELWTQKAEVTGRLSWNELTKLLIMSVARDGEAIVRVIYNTKHNKFKFVLQVIDPVALDEMLNEDEGKDGKSIKLGVEIDEFGAPMAYYFKTNSARNSVVKNGNNYLRIPAEEIIHIYMTENACQTRGYPWCHTCIRGIRALQSYISSEVIAARIAASKMGIYTQTSASDPSTEFDLEEDVADVGAFITQAEPGSFEIAPRGWDFKTFNAEHPNVAYKDFVKGVLRGIASGLGVSYTSLANDVESVNFSSLRSSLLEERENWKGLQEFFIDAFMRPVYQKWLKAAVLSGQLKLKAAEIEQYENPSFLGRRWSWVDPKKDTESALAAIAGGIKSRQEVATEQGRTIEDIFLELKREEELIKTYGLKTQIKDGEKKEEREDE